MKFVNIFLTCSIFQNVLLLYLEYFSDNHFLQLEEEENIISATCTVTEEKQKELGLKTKEMINFTLEIEYCYFRCYSDDKIKTLFLNDTTTRATIHKREFPNDGCFVDFRCWWSNPQKRHYGPKLLDEVTYYLADGVDKGKPEMVQDFNCQFFIFKEVVCSWLGPEYFVNTLYNLTYTSRNDDMEKKDSWRTSYCNGSSGNSGCNTGYDKTALRKYVCTWKLEYGFHANKYYDFALQIKNLFGYITHNVSLNLYEHLIAGAPEVKVEYITSNEIHLDLRIDNNSPYYICSEKHLFEFLISYRHGTIKTNWNADSIAIAGHTHAVLSADSMSQYESVWSTKNVSACQYSYVLFPTTRIMIGPLSFGNANYSIKVVTVNKFYKGKGDGKSKDTVITQKTLPKTPNKAPETTLGSFETTDEYSVRIYWRKMKKAEENGDEFRYKIEIDKKISRQIINSTTDNFLDFCCLKDRNYTFKIWSVNEIGKSMDFSTVFVPAYRYRTHYVQKVTEIFDETNHQYLLKWEPLMLKKRIRNYIVFWCEDQLLITNLTCESNLQWEVLPPTSSSFTKSVQGQNYHFAVSSNDESTSSGMTRASSKCKLTKTALKDNLEIYVEQQNATSVTITWNPNCAGLNYAVSYCPVEYEENGICLQPEITSTVSSSYRNYIITNLESDTLYFITLTPLSTLFPKERVSKIIRTPGPDSKLALMFTIFVLIVFVGAGILILTQRLRDQFRENEIEPILPPGLTSLVNSLILDYPNYTKAMTNSENQNGDYVNNDIKQYNFTHKETTELVPAQVPYVACSSSGNDCQPSQISANSISIVKSNRKHRNQIVGKRERKNVYKVKFAYPKTKSRYCHLKKATDASSKSEYVYLENISDKKINEKVILAEDPKYIDEEEIKTGNKDYSFTVNVSGYLPHDNFSIAPIHNRNNNLTKDKEITCLEYIALNDIPKTQNGDCVNNDIKQYNFTHKETTKPIPAQVPYACSSSDNDCQPSQISANSISIVKSNRKHRNQIVGKRERKNVYKVKFAYSKTKSRYCHLKKATDATESQVKANSKSEYVYLENISDKKINDKVILAEDPKYIDEEEIKTVNKDYSFTANVSGYLPHDNFSIAPVHNRNNNLTKDKEIRCLKYIALNDIPKLQATCEYTTNEKTRGKEYITLSDIPKEQTTFENSTNKKKERNWLYST